MLKNCHCLTQKGSQLQVSLQILASKNIIVGSRAWQEFILFSINYETATTATTTIVADGSVHSSYSQDGHSSYSDQDACRHYSQASQSNVVH